MGSLRIIAFIGSFNARLHDQFLDGEISAPRRSIGQLSQRFVEDLWTALATNRGWFFKLLIIVASPRGFEPLLPP